MRYSAILFGAIGTLAETSELQRQAYNAAFAGFDLDWVWEPDAYYRMLHAPGGHDRVARYAEDSGDTVDPAAIHAAKQAIFATLVDRHGLEPRPGVTETISAARQAGVRTAFCTTTTPDQVGLILDGLTPQVTREDFAWIGDIRSVSRGKPAPDIYLAALEALGLEAGKVLAIEDTPESAEAALAAGIETIGFPGVAAADRDFPEGVTVVKRLGRGLLNGDKATAAA